MTWNDLTWQDSYAKTPLTGDDFRRMYEAAVESMRRPSPYRPVPVSMTLYRRLMCLERWQRLSAVRHLLWLTLVEAGAFHPYKELLRESYRDRVDDRRRVRQVSRADRGRQVRGPRVHRRRR